MGFATTQNQFNSTKEVVNNQINNNHVYTVPELVYGGEWRDANGNYLGELWCVYNNGTYVTTIYIAA